MRRILFAFICLPFFLAFNPLSAIAQETADTDDLTVEEEAELLKFDVQGNAKRLLAFVRINQGVKEEIQAYAFRYPSSHRPRIISRWAIKHDIELAERDAGLRARGRHNPLQIRGTSNIELNGKTFLSYPWKVKDKNFIVYAWTSKQNVVVIRTSTEGNSSASQQEHLAKLKAMMPCLCDDFC